MDILQVFTQYGNDLLQEIKNTDYFQAVKIRDRYMGVYLFIRDYFCADMRTKNQVRQIFDSIYHLLDDTVNEKSVV